MAELKTQPTNASAVAFLKTIEPKEKRDDALALLKMFKEVTGEKPVMWGAAIVGFGKYHYKSERSTQEGFWPLTGFSPRKQNLTVYLMSGFQSYKDLLNKLGKHKVSGGSCLYIHRLSDIDMNVLQKLIKESFESMRKKYDV
jgi:Domain of unknown function (DU1801)